MNGSLSHYDPRLQFPSHQITLRVAPHIDDFSALARSSARESGTTDGAYTSAIELSD